MSLTSIIKKNSDIKKEFPRVKSYLTDHVGSLLSKEEWKSQIKVASIGTSYEAGHIGTTFDYVARAILAKHFNSVGMNRRLVAQEGMVRFPIYVNLPFIPTGDAQIDDERMKGHKKVSEDVEVIKNYLEACYDRCVENRQKFLEGECDLAQVIKDAAFLARLDETLRIGSIHVADYYFKEVDGRTYFSQRRMLTDKEVSENVAQLADLFIKSIKDMPWHNVVLNPDFAEYSLLLGGADADFIVDDCIVDIKTHRKLSYRGEDFAQLFGYTAMASKVGFNINRVAIYYARFGLFAFFDLSNLDNDFLNRYWATLMKKANA